jgi:outer membrane protein OmpA-like peptidoglycan-associated protein
VIFTRILPSCFCLACLSMSSVLAQDLQIGIERLQPRSLEIHPPSGYLSLKSKSSDALSFRYSHDLWKPREHQVLEATAGLRLPSEKQLTYSNSAGASGDVQARLRLGNQYALGALYRYENPFGLPLETGIGLDHRWESLVMKDGALESSGKLNRFWVRAVLRHRFSPEDRGFFMAIEYARPLTSAPTPSGVDYMRDMDNLGSSPNPGTSAKAHAPTYSLSLAAGYRFGQAPKPVSISAPAPAPEPIPATPVESVEVPVVPPQESTPVVPESAPVISETVPAQVVEPVLPKIITLDEASFHFALNRAEVPAQGLEVLKAWAARIKALEQAPRLTVIGHTDSTGRRPFNLKLSLARAQSIADALKAEGLVVDGVEGQGPDQPIAPNDTPKGRARNRRVEIRLEAEGIKVEGQSNSELMLETPKPISPSHVKKP